MPVLRSVDDLRSMIESRPRNPKTGCWECSNLKSTGYGQVGWRGKKWTAHRLSWELFRGPIPPGTVVRHLCDNRCCCNPDHLEVGTQKRNMEEAHERERTQTTLTTTQAEEIRGRRGERQVDLAAEYGVSQPTISKILLGATWRHAAGLDGCRDSRAKLTPDDVREIRTLLPTLSNRQIAEKFGMTAPAIHAIRQGRTWRYV